MKRLTLAWKTALVATALAAVVLLATLVLFPVGKADAAHYDKLTILMDEHLAEIDNRLQDLELHTSSPMACPLTMNTPTRQGLTAYTIDATITFAHYDETRGDWVPTCESDAQYYAITLEGTWPNGPAPIVLEVAAGRYYEAEFQNETSVTATP